MNIKNAYVFTETAQFVRKDVSIAGQYITDSHSEGEDYDATDLYLIPGLIDIHFHGCINEDFSDASDEGLHKIAAYQAANGITTICPATVTLSEEQLTKICKVAKDFEPEENEAELVGIHLEGPFLSKDKLGAQNPEFIQKANVEKFDRLQAASDGLVKLISVAPETEGAIDFIKEVSQKGVACSLAHTVADYDTAHKAFEAGACHVTHLYNAMPPFHHRDPGVIGAAFDAEGCKAELICDGVHIHPAVVRASIAMFGEDRITLVSDSMRACGLSDGMYTLGGLDVEVNGNSATLVKGGNLAGSVTNLMGCLKVAVKEMGIELETAVRLATMNPAQAIGIYDTHGSITPGKIANAVLMTENMEIKQIIVRGKAIL